MGKFKKFNKIHELSKFLIHKSLYFDSINQRCVDPCPGSCGLSTECTVINHTPSCRCAVHYTGDPFQGCSPVQGKYNFYLISRDQFEEKRYTTMRFIQTNLNWTNREYFEMNLNNEIYPIKTELNELWIFWNEFSSDISLAKCFIAFKIPLNKLFQ